MRRIDDQPFGDLADLAGDGLMRAVLDDQPPRRRAALAGAEERGLHCDHRRRVDIGRVPDDQRIVAAQFQRQIFCGQSANWRWSAMPARAEPVKRRPSIPGWDASVRPWSGPPIRQRTTPSGTPASWNSFTRNSPTAGVFSDGLTTPALPALTAGTTNGRASYRERVRQTGYISVVAQS